MRKKKCSNVVVCSCRCVQLHLANMRLKLKEINMSSKQNSLEDANWQVADQVAIYKHGRGVDHEPGSAIKKQQGCEPATSAFHSRCRPSHSATLPTSFPGKRPWKRGCHFTSPNVLSSNGGYTKTIIYFSFKN